VDGVMGSRAEVDWHFTIVPEWVLDAPISDVAVRLYGVLRRYADKAGECIPGRKTLAERLRKSPSTVDRAARELIAIGALEIEPRYDSRGDQTSNLYRLFSVPPYARVNRGVVTGDDTPSSWVTSQEREPREGEPGERESSPHAPGKPGVGGCAAHGSTPHANCRGCATSPRQRIAASRKRGPWCGACREDNRMFEDPETGEWSRCSCATPLAQRRGPGSGSAPQRDTLAV
jgi:hypothetical protein